MRILIVSGHFSPDVGYQEVHLARAYARTGHRVRVVTTTFVPERLMRSKPRRYRPGLSTEEGYEIVRLRIVLRVGTTLIPAGMRRAIMSFRPDLVIGIGIAKFMPVLAAHWKRAGRYQFVSIFGDAHKHRDPASSSLRDRTSAAARNLGFATLKRGWYRYTISRSDRVIATTPEAQAIISSRFPAGEHGARLHFVPLGYDEALFFFDEDERRRVRRQLGIGAGDTVLVTATKIERSKRIEALVEAFEQLALKDLDLRWLVIGFGRSAYADEIRERAERSPVRDRILCMPFMEVRELRAHYNAADVGVWTRETITIQEAMGTGLTVVLPRDNVLAHLVVEGENGTMWTSDRELADRIAQACRALGSPAGRASRRRSVEKLNSRLSYRVLAEQLREGL